MNHTQALKIAESLVKTFRPACVRIEIQGSLRRLNPDVKDIDLLAVPDLTPLPMPRAEFGKPVPRIYKTALDKIIGEMEEQGSIRLEKFGDRRKQFYVVGAGIYVELYLVLSPATWGVLSLIRTGPSDFGHWCVTRHKSGGALPNGFRVQDGAVWKGEKEVKDLTGEQPIGFESEKDFLNFLGLGWVEPSERVARWSGARA